MTSTSEHAAQPAPGGPDEEQDQPHLTSPAAVGSPPFLYILQHTHSMSMRLRGWKELITKNINQLNAA